MRSLPLSSGVWLRLLLRLYPAAFRRAYGDQILVVIQDLRREAAADSGFLAARRFWVMICADVIASAVEEAMDTLFVHGRSRLKEAAPLLLAFAAAASGLVAGFSFLVPRMIQIPAAPLNVSTPPPLVSEVLLFVIVAAVAPVVLGVVLSVGIAMALRRPGSFRLMNRPAHPVKPVLGLEDTVPYCQSGH